MTSVNWEVIYLVSIFLSPFVGIAVAFILCWKIENANLTGIMMTLGAILAMTLTVLTPLLF